MPLAARNIRVGTPSRGSARPACANARAAAVPEGRVVKHMPTPVVQDGHDAAGVAALDLLIGLDRQMQAAILGFGVQDADPRHAKHHGCARATRDQSLGRYRSSRAPTHVQLNDEPRRVTRPPR